MEPASLRPRDTSGDPADLASIVLGHAYGGDDDGGGVRRWHAPEHVPLDTDRGASIALDARSALVLALVVAVIVGGVAWATTTWRSAGDTAAPAAATTTTGDSSAATVADTTTTAPADATPALAPGTDLAIGRIVPARGASGAGIVAVGISNRGSVASTARQGATVLVLVDGEVAASDAVPAIEPGESTRVTVALDTCPTGTVSITAVVDPGAVVKESDERNNATSRQASFGC
ncbi:MAG: hypothetical protein KDC46_15305 [Thermoleophilia bacterium]|nr:hypothetical protein [Thermoleophilia bacterium]